MICALVNSYTRSRSSVRYSMMSDLEDLQEVSIPKNRTEILKWNGWGYKDTQFELGKDREVL